MKLQADYIKHSLTPLDFYRHELPEAKLKKDDWNDGGLCPFHSDKKPGSFYVNIETDAYKCFSCGAAGSDVIAFTMNLYGIQFIESLELLTREWRL